MNIFNTCEIYAQWVPRETASWGPWASCRQWGLWSLGSLSHCLTAYGHPSAPTAGLSEARAAPRSLRNPGPRREPAVESKC